MMRSMSAKAEQKIPDAGEHRIGLVMERGMVDLIVAYFTMAVAAERHQRAIVFATRDMMQLQGSAIALATHAAARVIRSQRFQTPLLAALTRHFSFIHSILLSGDDPVDFVENLAAGGGEAV